MADKFCINCKFHSSEKETTGGKHGRKTIEYHFCHHPESWGMDNVTGVPGISNAYATRNNGFRCGPTGNWFVPKKK